MSRVFRTDSATGRSLLAIATGKQPRRRGKGSYQEFIQQAEFIQRCRDHPVIKDLRWIGNIQGANLTKTQRGLAYARGSRRGFPDFLLLHRARQKGQSPRLAERRGLALEFKSPTGKGRPSKEQREWTDGLLDQDIDCAYPTTADEAWGILLTYLGLTE